MQYLNNTLFIVFPALTYEIRHLNILIRCVKTRKSQNSAVFGLITTNSNLNEATGWILIQCHSLAVLFSIIHAPQ